MFKATGKIKAVTIVPLIFFSFFRQSARCSWACLFRSQLHLQLIFRLRRRRLLILSSFPVRVPRFCLSASVCARRLRAINTCFAIPEPYRLLGKLANGRPGRLCLLCADIEIYTFQVTEATPRIASQSSFSAGVFLAGITRMPQAATATR